MKDKDDEKKAKDKNKKDESKSNENDDKEQEDKMKEDDNDKKSEGGNTKKKDDKDKSIEESNKLKKDNKKIDDGSENQTNSNSMNKDKDDNKSTVDKDIEDGSVIEGKNKRDVQGEDVMGKIDDKGIDKTGKVNTHQKNIHSNLSSKKEKSTGSHIGSTSIKTQDEKVKSMFRPNSPPDMVIEDIEEGDVIEIKSVEEHPEDQNQKETNELIYDIMAAEEENSKIKTEEKHDRKYMKKTLIKKIPFDMGNLDVYMHVKYQHVNVFVRYGVECFIVLLLFLFFPILLIFLRSDSNGYFLLQHLKRDQKINPLSEFLRHSVFISLTYIVFIASSLFTDNLLYTCAFLLSTFGISVKGSIAELLQILNASKRHIRDMITSFVVFYIAIILISDYKFFNKQKDITYLTLTGFFLFGCVSMIMFFERFLMNMLTSELRRKSFRNRIWDTNYKTFVFKKLAAIAEASPSGKHRVNEIIMSLNNEYDTGFFLRHNDLDLTTQEQAIIIAEGIFGYLEIDELEYSSIKKFFLQNPEEVYSYISGVKITNETQDFPPIPFEDVKSRCLDLFQERMDITKTLHDRDNILRKLDFILLAIVAFFSVMICFVLLDVNYKIYVASIGPTIFGFGWIFQDSIKELYRCFVFHLINHHYDCGDRIVIDNEDLVVTKIDLLYTTFMTPTGKSKYIPNASMFLKNIENIRRSNLQCENITVVVAASTSFSKIIDIRDKISEIFKLDKTNFTGSVAIINYESIGPNMKVTFSIEHSTNFQDSKPRQLRREISIKIIEKTLDEVGVKYDHCYIISD